MLFGIQLRAIYVTDFYVSSYFCRAFKTPIIQHTVPKGPKSDHNTRVKSLKFHPDNGEKATNTLETIKYDGTCAPVASGPPPIRLILQLSLIDLSSPPLHFLPLLSVISQNVRGSSRDVLSHAPIK